MNSHMMNKFPGNENIYQSSDSVDQEHIYLLKFINHLNLSGFLPHMLRLKVGVCIMLFRNLDPCNKHCNGTQYIITHLDHHIIKGEVDTGNHKGKRFLIPCIPLVPGDNIYPFNTKRKQFPMKAAFAMTVKKEPGPDPHKERHLPTNGLF